MSHSGLRGPIAFCPNCDSDCTHIKWDAESDTNTCLSCGWTDRPVSEWISVKERLPKAREDVLCTTFWHECYQVRVGWYNDVGSMWYILTSHGEMESRTVTHWMPLPEPPKEG